MEGRLRGIDQALVAAGSSGQVLRTLLTTVMCLSNYAQEVACWAAAPPLLSSPAFPQVIVDKPLFIFPTR